MQIPRPLAQRIVKSEFVDEIATAAVCCIFATSNSSLLLDISINRERKKLSSLVSLGRTNFLLIYRTFHNFSQQLALRQDNFTEKSFKNLPPLHQNCFVQFLLSRTNFFANLIYHGFLFFVQLPSTPMIIFFQYYHHSVVE